MYKCLKNFSTQISWSTVHSAIITEGKSHLKNRQVFIEDKKSTPRKCQGASAKQNKWSICHCSVPVKSLWHTSPNISDVLSGSTVFPCSNMYIYGYIYIYACMYKTNYFKESWRYRVTLSLSIKQQRRSSGQPHAPSVATLVGRRLKPTSITSGTPRQASK